MKKVFTYILEWPAWVIGAVIVAQIVSVGLTLGLTGYHAWNQYRQPVPVAGWSLDSTTYYKNLYQQGKLNYDLYLSQKTHGEQLARLDKKRKVTHHRIDSLSGPALQRELDSLYNGGQRSSSRAPGPKAHAADGGRSASGAQRPGRPADASGRSTITIQPTGGADAGDHGAGADDQPAKPTSATASQRRADRPEPGAKLPDEVARSQTGELDLARRAGAGRSPQTRISLDYWQRIWQQGYVYPDIAWAISAVETGYWDKRTAIMKGHNLFAFKPNRRRAYQGVSAGYCTYWSEDASLADYGQYELQVIERYKLTSRQAYIDHLCKRFCPNPTYRGKLDLAFQALRKIKPLA